VSLGLSLRPLFFLVFLLYRLMDIDNLETRSLFNELSLGITLVVRIRESGSKSYQEKLGVGDT